MTRFVAALMCCLGAVQAFAGEPVEAPTLAWREARWGMAPAEVLAAFPGEARRPQRPDRHDEGPILVEIPKLEMGGTSYRVDFVFAEEKLALIQITAALRPEPEAVRQYDALLKSLSDRHGPPAACSTKDRSTKVIQDTGVRCHWATPSASVALERYLIAPKAHVARGFPYDVHVTISYVQPGGSKAPTP